MGEVRQELSAAEVQAVLARCQARTHRLVQVAWLRAWSRVTFGLLLLVLVGLSARKALGHQDFLWPWLLSALLVGAFVTPWTRFNRSVPSWRSVAWLDHAASAQGTLMQASAEPACVPRVPRTALTLAFPSLGLFRLAGTWAIYLVAFLIWYIAPVARPEDPAAYVAPLRVQRANQELARLQKLEPNSEAFIERARESLTAMAAQEEGLTKADFDALEHIEEQTEALLEKGAFRIRAARDAMEELESLLAESESPDGAAGAARQLAESLRKNAAALQKSGLSQQALDRLVARAEEAAQKGQAAEQNGKSAELSFDSSDVEALEKAIGDFQEYTMQRLRGGGMPEDGAGEPEGEGQEGEDPNGPSRPGGEGGGEKVSPLLFTNDEIPPEGQFKDETFRAHVSPDTVTLATSMSKREEKAVSDAATSEREFASGTDALHEDKTVLPRHRAALEAYFGE